MISYPFCLSNILAIVELTEGLLIYFYEELKIKGLIIAKTSKDTGMNIDWRLKAIKDWRLYLFWAKLLTLKNKDLSDLLVLNFQYLSLKKASCVKKTFINFIEDSHYFVRDKCYICWNYHSALFWIYEASPTMRI